jgi:hypothetical protein
MVGVLAAGWVAGCSSKNGVTPPSVDAGTTPDSSAPALDGAAADAGTDADPYTYTLIDDMENTVHGPIELAGIMSPDSPGYWFNFGANKPEDAGPPPDTADPAIQMFTFTALPTPTTTLHGKTSTKAAHQTCNLNSLYDVCGIGFEFAQIPDLDAGTDGGDAGGDAGSAVDASIHDAGADGDAGPSIPMTTIPFDISKYKGISFWGRSALDDGGGVDVKVLFPDTDTDPRGNVCNSAAARASGPTDLSQCYNSYAVHETFYSTWTKYDVLFSDPSFGIDPTFGFQNPQPWSGTNVYGVNFQEQDNATPDSTNQPMDLWIDDVYFIQ